MTGATKWAFKSTLAVATPVVSGGSLINSTEALLKAPFGQRTITLGLDGLVAGANVLTIGNHGSSALVTEVYGNATGTGYGGKSGTIRVTYTPASKSLIGTFIAVCVDENDSSREITLTGSFSATTQ